MTQRHSVLLTIELGNCYCNCYSPIVTVIVTVIISLFPPRGNWKMKAVSLERLTQVEKVAAVLNRTVLNHRITTVLNWGRSKLGRVTKPTVLLGKFCEGFPLWNESDAVTFQPFTPARSTVCIESPSSRPQDISFREPEDTVDLPRLEESQSWILELSKAESFSRVARIRGSQKVLELYCTLRAAVDQQRGAHSSNWELDFNLLLECSRGLEPFGLTQTHCQWLH